MCSFQLRWKSITKANADRLRCKIVVEGANEPTSPEADIILHQKGITVVPDILANAGGVTVSYFEWVQGLMHLFWTEDEVNSRLEQIMGRACDQVFELSSKSGLRQNGGAANRRVQTSGSKETARTLSVNKLK